MNVRKISVPAEAAGWRADTWLAARFSSWSRSAIAQAIRVGMVTSESRALKPASELHPGEVLVLELPELAPVEDKPECPPVVHEDDRIVAFSKPPGLLAHPVGARFTWGLINLARERYPGENLHLAHRLDRDTSGVSLVARDDAANRFLKDAFKLRRVTKTYWAIVRGEPAWEKLEIDAPLAHDPSSPIELKQGVVEGGAHAVTRVRVIRRFGAISLVSCRPLTGRTHQIRAHLEHVGHAILGDRIYGQDPSVFLSLLDGEPVPDLRERLGHPRQCLHARAVHLPHPDGGELHIRAPMPADMAEILVAHGA